MCVFRIVVGRNVELIMVVHVDGIVVVGSDETCKDIHDTLAVKFPTDGLGE